MTIPVPSLIDELCVSDPARVAAALQALRVRDESQVPVLLARIAQAAVEPDHWTGLDDQPSPTFLLFVAAAWRETAAHPLLAALLRLPARQCEAVLDDFITEGAGRVLADTWPGDLVTLNGVAHDRGANSFARGAALTAVGLLAARGRLARAEALEFLGRLVAEPLDPAVGADVDLATNVVSTLVDLRAWELRGTVVGLAERGLIDESFIGVDEALDELEPGAVLNPESYRFPPPIDDPWEAVRQWHFFTPLFTKRQSRGTLASLPPLPSRPVANAGEPPGDPYDGPPQPYVAPPKPGRNDPCSCGSGRKYKKCCGA